MPTIPLWLALSAALPATWSIVAVYFGITVILSLIGWTGLARVVRGKLLELREADFVLAARIAGKRELPIIRQHLLPSFASYLVVDISLRIPGMILGETALSFLGFGIRPPAGQPRVAADRFPERRHPDYPPVDAAAGAVGNRDRAVLQLVGDGPAATPPILSLVVGRR